MARRVKIAACQGIWTTSTDQNLQRMEVFAQGISAEWGEMVKLISFTEYAVTGFHPGKLAESAEPIPGPASDRLCEMASKYKLWICSGSQVEKDNGNLYNTSLLISPEGNIAIKYRKTHPFSDPYGSEVGIKCGKEYPVYDVPGMGKVGIMICSDMVFPEVARALAWNGAELILWPTMAFPPLRDPLLAMAVARAWENNCYLMATCGTGQHVGIGLMGHSMLVDPDGQVLNEVGDGETILIDTVDFDYVTVARNGDGRRLTPVFKFMKLFGHTYPQYADFLKGEVYKQIA